MSIRMAVSSLFLALLYAVGRSHEGLTHAQTAAGDVRPVADLDVARYMGRWYELGRYPNRFQRKCTGDVVVYYASRPDGRIDVKNTCATTTGTIEALGVARRADPKGPASVLEVRFAPAFLSFLPVWGDYWVLDLDRDYQTAVVGTPERDYLWILSRSPHADAGTYARLVESVRAQGYDVTRIVRTTHQ